MNASQTQKMKQRNTYQIRQMQINEDTDEDHSATADVENEETSLDIPSGLGCEPETVTVELVDFHLIQLFPTINLPHVNLKGYTIKVCLKFEKINNDSIRGMAIADIDRHTSMIMWQCKTVTLQGSSFDIWQSCDQPIQLGYFNRSMTLVNLTFYFKGLIYEKIQYTC